MSVATILSQIAALQANLSAAKVAERATYRANVRPALLTGFKTLTASGLDRRAAAAAIRAIEPTIAANRPAIATPASVANHATAPRRNADKMPSAQREAIEANRAYFVGKQWSILPTDRLYPTLEVNPKKAQGAGYYRFAIMQDNPGLTVAEFKRLLSAAQDSGALWAGGKAELTGEITYNLNTGMIRLVRE